MSCILHAVNQNDYLLIHFDERGKDRVRLCTYTHGQDNGRNEGEK